jgi:uncharacterized protein YceH (UPF0502 family)
MATFDSLDEIQHELDLLNTREEPLAHNVGRRQGQKEERWATTLVPAPAPDQPHQPMAAADPSHDDELRAELAELRAEVADLRQEVHELRESLGG